jgi:transketolase
VQVADQHPTWSSQIRRIVLDESRRANVGHVGSALSIADIVAVLFQQVLHLPRIDDPSRDRFVLSKGHAALALYAALYLKGLLTREQLDSFCQDRSLLEVHPNHCLPGIEFSTGSLGQGLSIGAGVALAARLRREPFRTFVLMSDAECDEGSVWEAAMFAAHHKLASLVAIIDDNGQQALGSTREVLDLSPLAERWSAFGWRAHEVDGHDVERLVSTFRSLDTEHGAPHVVVAKTVSGKGVPFMERKVEWHYLSMTESQYAEALAVLAGGAGGRE